jgi:hypothetical protein
MKRGPWLCDACGTPERKDTPLHLMHDGLVMLCKTCFLRELERIKVKE